MAISKEQPLRPYVQALGDKVDEMEPQPEYIQECVSDWLDAHPEATTTVQPNSITRTQLNAGVALTSAELAAILV